MRPNRSRPERLDPDIAGSGPTDPLPRADPMIARVGACAVGLAYAERSDDEAIDCLIDLAGGRIAVLAAARQRIRTLAGLDRQVIDHAVGLTDAAIRSQQRRIRPQMEGVADG